MSLYAPTKAGNTVKTSLVIATRSTGNSSQIQRHTSVQLELASILRVKGRGSQEGWTIAEGTSKNLIQNKDGEKPRVAWDYV